MCCEFQLAADANANVSKRSEPSNSAVYKFTHDDFKPKVKVTKLFVSDLGSALCLTVLICVNLVNKQRHIRPV